MDRQARDRAELAIAAGQALEDEGDIAAALQHFREATACAPDHARGHLNVGNALRKLGREADAAAAYREALRLDPGSHASRFNLGTLLHGLGAHDEAEAQLRASIRLRPDVPETAIALAGVLESTGRLDEAETELARTLAAHPDHAGAALNLGHVLGLQGRYDDAERWFLRAQELDPAMPHADAKLGALYLRTGRIALATRAYERSLAADPDLRNDHSDYLFCLNLRTDLSPREIFDEHVRIAGALTVRARPAYTTWSNAPLPDRPLRIGYVSADYRAHAAAVFMRPLLRSHDRSSFDVYCYDSGTAPDAVTGELRQLVAQWRDIARVSDADAAARIRSDAIDVLVDLSGHTAGHRLGVFARSPAPVQVTWLGYLNTTGLPGMHYRICDACTDPPGATDPLHTERLVRMPHAQWCYAPVVDAPPRRVRQVAAGTAPVFGSFNQLAKLSDACVGLWCRVLARVPDSRLIVLDVPAGRARGILLDRFADNGIDPARIEPAGRLPIDRYLDTVGDVDIALDSMPYNGATTTFDALWMGTPVVALRGERGISRGAYSILRTLGMPELTADDADAYVALNVRLARDVEWRRALRSSLRARLCASPLMDAPRFARDLEAGFRRMWRAWCASRA
jgi:predicted O-linked N-acetylglucosamine transferase (SPINDLY family)